MILRALKHPTYCDAHGCRSEWGVRYLAGSTLLNPNKDVRLCHVHEKAWLDEEAACRASFDGLAHVQAAHHKPKESQ